MDKVDVKFPTGPKAPAGNLPKTAEERAVALADLMERLAAQIGRETAAVGARARAPHLAALAKEKQPMSLVYEEVSRLLRVDRAGLESLPAALKERLRTANRTLAQAAADNSAALRRAADAQTLLVDTLVTTVNKARRIGHPSYGPAAAGYASPYGAAAGGPARHGPATAATLNTRL